MNALLDRLLCPRPGRSGSIYQLALASTDCDSNMKVKAAFVALVSTLVASCSAQDDSCDLFQLVILLEDSDVVRCGLETGFSLLEPTPPSQSLVERICSVDACLDAVDTIDAVNLDDCLLLTALHLESDLLAPIFDICYEPATADANDSGSASMMRRRRRGGG